MQQGRVDQAFQAFLNAVRHDSRSIAAWLQLGQLYLQSGRFSEAAGCFRRVTEIDQGHMAAYGSLGVCYYRLQRLDEAATSYLRVLELDKENIAALCNLAMVLLDRGEREQAAALCDQAIGIQAGNAGIYVLRGSVHLALAEYEQAAASYHQASELDPNMLSAVAGEANALIKLGRMAGAYALIEPHVQSTVSDVPLAIAYASTCVIHGNSAKATEYLEKILMMPSLTPKQRLQLHFSAGELYDLMKRYDKAFSHYRAGNSLVDRHYSPEAVSQLLHKTRAAYTPDILESLACQEDSPVTPVFIVGMPRSGTSLVERILSRHSGVHAGGEMPYIPQISAGLCDKAGHRIVYPENIADVDIGNIRLHAEQHMDRLVRMAGGCSIVTDKLPHNFMYLGLIQILYPGARVVHCRRDALDTCLSNYFQYYSGSLDFAYRLEDIAHHYNHYVEYMAHWRSVLDLDILEVDYENLVERQEATTRELLRFCGLHWEPDCMTFHESADVTRTASYAQVRQPLYRSSVGRWRNYEKHLRPLIKNLNPELLGKI